MTAIKKAILFVLGVATVLLSLYVFVLNTGTVEVHLASDRSVALPLGVMLVGVFVAGFVVAATGLAVLQAGQALRGWRTRRLRRQTARIEEWLRAGKALLWDGDLQRARALLDKAWRKQPQNSEIALTLASSYLYSGEYEAARRTLGRAVAHGASAPEVRLALSEAAERSGDLSEAIRAVEALHLQYPRAAAPLQRLRFLYQQSNRWQEAADAQESYLQCIPTGEPARGEHRLLTELRYEAALSRENTDARVQALAALLQSDRTFLPAAVSLGDTLAAAGRTEEAIQAWERAFRTMPRAVLIERILAHQSTPKERERTVALMKKYIEEMGSDAVHALAARTALEDGQVQTAAAELNAIGHAQGPFIGQLRARILQARNETDQAWEASTQALSEAVRLTTYCCRVCGRFAVQWTGRCPGCGKWDTVRVTMEKEADRAA